MAELSFSATVKSELILKNAPDDDGLRAELAGLVVGAAQVEPDASRLCFVTDQEKMKEKISVMLERLFGLTPKTVHRGKNWRLELLDAQARQVLQDLWLWEEESYVHRVPFELVSRPADLQSFIRGVFLGCGTMSDPWKSYHAEFSGTDPVFLTELEEALSGFGLEFRELERSIAGRVRYSIYIKEQERLSDLLNVMQAYTAMMELENISIEKEMRNQINRSVNCEAANLNKSIQASLRQCDEIRFLVGRIGWESLPDSLVQIARIRLDHPEESLSELGQYLDVPIGRSGVNHRLRRLSEMADQFGYSADKESSGSQDTAVSGEEGERL